MEYGDIQFLAGIIEGGGYIGVLESKGKFIPVLRIRRSSPEIIERINALYPGSRGTTYKDGKPLYWLNYQGNKVYNLLRLVEPYLVSKKMHAKKVFQLEMLVERHKKQFGAHSRLTDDERKQRRMVVAEVQYLNRTNPPVDVSEEPEEPAPNLFDI